MLYMINICGIKLYNYIFTYISKFIRSISYISSYMFRLIYSHFRLVFGVVLVIRNLVLQVIGDLVTFKTSIIVHTNHSEI